MQEHCRAAKHKLRFSVNVSKRQLFIPSFTEQALAELARRGIPSDEIMWEVTESVALRDVEHAAERLHELKAAGFKIAIDDFGTGYSSLSQLHEIHADELKIDISFVRRIHEPAGLSLVQAIIHIASALGLHTVAEGVEDAAAAEALRELGVDYLQGYHFARPCRAKNFSAGWKITRLKLNPRSSLSKRLTGLNDWQGWHPTRCPFRVKCPQACGCPHTGRAASVDWCPDATL